MPRRPPRLPPLLAEFDDEEREAVLAANRAFYRAFAEPDVAGMDQIWAQTGAVVCLHPGQAPCTAAPRSWQAGAASCAIPNRPRCAAPANG